MPFKKSPSTWPQIKLSFRNGNPPPNDYWAPQILAAFH
jgi:hypothetical protein